MAEVDKVTKIRMAKAYFATGYQHPQIPHRYAGMWGAPGIPSQWARDRHGQVQDFLTREEATAAAAICLCAALNRAKSGGKAVIVRGQRRREAQQTADKVFAAFK